VSVTQCGVDAGVLGDFVFDEAVEQAFSRQPSAISRLTES
jgi:hypothetical protein